MLLGVTCLARRTHVPHAASKPGPQRQRGQALPLRSTPLIFLGPFPGQPPAPQASVLEQCSGLHDSMVQAEAQQQAPTRLGEELATAALLAAASFRRAAEEQAPGDEQVRVCPAPAALSSI